MDGIHAGYTDVLFVHDTGKVGESRVTDVEVGQG